jgi:hypothetical protein
MALFVEIKTFFLDFNQMETDQTHTLVLLDGPMALRLKEQRQDMAFQIQTLLNTYQIEELKHLLTKRKYMNRCNVYLIYLFHLIQSAGIMTTTIATGYNYLYLIWVGIGLNILASLLNIYEKNNTNIIKKLSQNISDIQKGKFVQEAPMEPPVEAPVEDASPNGKTPLMAGH